MKPITYYLLFIQINENLTLTKHEVNPLIPFPQPNPIFLLKCNTNNILLAGYELQIHNLLLQMITQHRVFKTQFDLYVIFIYIYLFIYYLKHSNKSCHGILFYTINTSIIYYYVL